MPRASRRCSRADSTTSSIALIPHAEALEAFRALARDRVYHSAVVLNLQSPGAAILGELLEAFVGAVEAAVAGALAAAARARCWIFSRGSSSPPTAGRRPISTRACSAITDFVSGMTDSYAVAIAAKVRAL